MSLPPIYSEREIITYTGGGLITETADLVNEIPLTVFLNDLELVTLVCSPTAYQELALGLLMSEGLITSYDEIKQVNYNEADGLLWINTRNEIERTENFLRRNITSCCGKGRASLYFVNDAHCLKPVYSHVTFTPQHLVKLIAMQEEKSFTFRKTGGVHSASLGDKEGIIAMYEDIGRHNAVDKVLGHILINSIAPQDKCLLLTGRISSEILIKAAHAGIPVVVSRSAPTQLAIDLADQLGIAVVGFARGNRLSVYSHTDKVI